MSPSLSTTKSEHDIYESYARFPLVHESHLGEVNDNIGRPKKQNVVLRASVAQGYLNLLAVQGHQKNGGILSRPQNIASRKLKCFGTAPAQVRVSDGDSGGSSPVHQRRVLENINLVRGGRKQTGFVYGRTAYQVFTDGGAERSARRGEAVGAQLGSLIPGAQGQDFGDGILLVILDAGAEEEEVIRGVERHGGHKQLETFGCK